MSPMVLLTHTLPIINKTLFYPLKLLSSLSQLSRCLCVRYVVLTVGAALSWPTGPSLSTGVCFCRAFLFIFKRVLISILISLLCYFRWVIWECVGTCENSLCLGENGKTHTQQGRLWMHLFAPKHAYDNFMYPAAKKRLLFFHLKSTDRADCSSSFCTKI